MSIRLMHGSCETELQKLQADSIDACVTDPPYGLKFMGKKWDAQVPPVSDWLAIYRVLKPGAHLLAFGGTRTYHRLVCNIEDAGFEIRDQLAWIFGSGFPKSHNLEDEHEGFGTALKPAHEPIVLARKPFSMTVADNMREHGTGALNIEGCRIAGAPTTRVKKGGANQFPHEDDAWVPREVTVGSDLGRWPANVLHDGSDEVFDAFPNAPGQLADASISSSIRTTQNVYGDMKRGNGRNGETSSTRRYAADGADFAALPGQRRNDSGSAARFFYCAKASRDDREDGLAFMELKAGVRFGQCLNNGNGDLRNGDGRPTKTRNSHPTVKPTELMRWLCRLITPPGGTVLDPFAGTGSTGRGAFLEGLSFIGIELEAQWLQIAEARIRAIAPLFAVFSEAAPVVGTV